MRPLLPAAASAHAAGDDRSKGQVMADTLVERVTGQTFAAAVPLEIGLIMTDAALLGRSETPAQLPGYGPIPAALARQLACAAGLADQDDHTSCDPNDSAPDRGGRGSGDRGTNDSDQRGALDGRGECGARDGDTRTGRASMSGVVGGGSVGGTEAGRARAWVRWLITDPIDGTVTSIDTRRRRFSGALAVFIRLRDQVCRDPYCDAPIRDLDHWHDYARGGPTSAENGIGLCQRENLVDQVPGWHITGTARERVIVTPTGHRYESQPPPALGPTLTTQRAAEPQEARAG